MATESVQNNNSKKEKDVTELIKEYETLITISQKAADTVLTVSEAAKIPDSVIETINLASEAYKMATKGAETLASVSTDSLGIVVAAATAATTALASLFDKLSEDLIKQNQLDETTQAIYNQTAAFNENVKAAEENMQSIEKQTNAAMLYWQEIEKLVDENGKAKGSTEELQRAVNKFNEVSGQSVIVIGDEIQGFEQLSATMKYNIEISRITAQMSYLQDSYAEALINIKDIQEQLDEAEEEAKRAEGDYLSKKKTYEEVSTKWGSYEATDDELHDATWPYENAKEVWEDAYTKTTALKLQKGTFQSTIDRYEELEQQLKNIKLSIQIENNDSDDKFTGYENDTQDKNTAALENLADSVDNSAELFQDTDFTSSVSATVQSGIETSIPAAAFVSQTENSSSESQSGCCCKINVDEILEGLNKPIKIMLNETELGEAVLTYARNNSQMTGN